MEISTSRLPPDLVLYLQKQLHREALLAFSITCRLANQIFRENKKAMFRKEVIFWHDNSSPSLPPDPTLPSFSEDFVFLTDECRMVLQRSFLTKFTIVFVHEEYLKAERTLRLQLLSEAHLSQVSKLVLINLPARKFTPPLVLSHVTSLDLRCLTGTYTLNTSSNNAGVHNMCDAKSISQFFPNLKKLKCDNLWIDSTYLKELTTPLLLLTSLSMANLWLSEELESSCGETYQWNNRRRLGILHKIVDPTTLTKLVIRNPIIDDVTMRTLPKVWDGLFFHDSFKSLTDRLVAFTELKQLSYAGVTLHQDLEAARLHDTLPKLEICRLFEIPVPDEPNEYKSYPELLCKKVEFGVKMEGDILIERYEKKDHQEKYPFWVRSYEDILDYSTLGHPIPV